MIHLTNIKLLVELVIEHGMVSESPAKSKVLGSDPTATHLKNYSLRGFS